jgi:redox-sensitive bicupin YhaK (pirin superfamily)
MNSLRRAKERHHDRLQDQESWLTFHPQKPASTPFDCFGALEGLNEIKLAPGAGVAMAPQRDAEVITYVREGCLAFEDERGKRGLIQAGQYRRAIMRRGVHQREANASRSDGVHFFQIWLPPSQLDIHPGQEQKRFSTADRRGALRVVASPDARNGSLLIHQEVVILSALLDPGQHVVHELASNRKAWLHLVRGAVTLSDITMATGDGAGVTSERALSLTAREEAELLLIELDEFPLASCRTGLAQPPNAGPRA